MYSISKLGNEFNLSRSTLLYYESIGLLKASERTKANYRIYSEKDRERLQLICLYREAGVPLEQIAKLLESEPGSEEDILKKRLVELNNQLYVLRLQQKILIEMLKSKNCNLVTPILDKSTFLSVLTASGVQGDVLTKMHIEFEKVSPEGHQMFLEFLGIDKDLINEIRKYSKKY